MRKRDKAHSVHTHYYADGKTLVEVSREVGGETMHYVFLQEQPKLGFVGVFRDITTGALAITTRVPVEPRDIAGHTAIYQRARELAARAIAQGPLQRLLRLVTTCYYGGAAYWSCLAESHGLRPVDVPVDEASPSSEPASAPPASAPPVSGIVPSSQRGPR